MGKRGSSRRWLTQIADEQGKRAQHIASKIVARLVVALRARNLPSFGDVKFEPGEISFLEQATFRHAVETLLEGYTIPATVTVDDPNAVVAWQLKKDDQIVGVIVFYTAGNFTIMPPQD